MLATFDTVVDPATNTYKRKIVLFNAESLGTPSSVFDSDPRIKLFTGGLPQFSGCSR